MNFLNRKEKKNIPSYTLLFTIKFWFENGPHVKVLAANILNNATLPCTLLHYGSGNGELYVFIPLKGNV